MRVSGKQTGRRRSGSGISNERMPMGKKWKWKSFFHICSCDAEISIWQMKLNVTYDVDRSCIFVLILSKLRIFHPSIWPVWFETSNSQYHLMSTTGGGAACRCWDYRNAARETSTPTLAAIFNHYLSRVCWASCSWETAFFIAIKLHSFLPDSCLVRPQFPTNGHGAAFPAIFSAGLEVQPGDLPALYPSSQGMDHTSVGNTGLALFKYKYQNQRHYISMDPTRREKKESVDHNVFIPKSSSNWGKQHKCFRKDCNLKCLLPSFLPSATKTLRLHFECDFFFSSTWISANIWLIQQQCSHSHCSFSLLDWLGAEVRRHP